ncbi:MULTISPECIES: hypothetical protein [Nocardia]|nr:MULTISPECIES: hypothetical protein [Nocardia]
MRRNMVRAGLASLAAAEAVAALAGTASSATDPTANVVGGRERVKVSVISNSIPGPQACNVQINQQSRASFQIVPGGKYSTVIAQVPPGTPTVKVTCGAATLWDRPEPVELANPVLDAVDSVFISAGSSELATDAALR